MGRPGTQRQAATLHLGFIANDVGLTTFPLVPGHEITGKIVAMGAYLASIRFSSWSSGLFALFASLLLPKR
jgi:hypothetical protein